MSQTIESDGDFTPAPGWPCLAAQGTPPVLDDLLSAPTGDTLLAQILALTPRGRAWGTDEADDGNGASPNLRGWWRALAAWAAWQFARDYDIAVQVFPSMATWSLDDWEAEYALPDGCITDPQTDADRMRAVQIKYALVGASSPDYLICLAASAGFAITITEFNPATIDDCIGDYLYGGLWGDTFQVNAPTTTVVYADVGTAEIDDPLADWGNAELECLINQAKQPQTQAIFAYLGTGGSLDDPFALDDGSGSGDKLT
jgi:uncharacterized protein YmfQ (DUF2313 family)